jgi:hypothetical protein
MRSAGDLIGVGLGQSGQRHLADSRPRSPKVREITPRECAGLPRRLGGFPPNNGSALKFEPGASELAIRVAYVGGQPHLIPAKANYSLIAVGTPA